jgi:5'(3')-deoxyribonucleotidase
MIKAEFLGNYMQSALSQGGFTDGRFAKMTDNFKKKVSEAGAFAFGGGSGGNVDAGALVDKQVGIFPWDKETPVNEMLKKVKGKWALVSRHDPKKVLQYYHGSGHPSKEWVSKVERRVHSFSESISDEWFKDSSFDTYKKATPVRYQTADKDGTLDTLEGPVAYKAGFKIVTGPKGEQYPIPPEKFAGLYDDNGDGTATPKKIMKKAKIADHDGVVNTSWGEPLNYTAGNDTIVRHGPNDYGVVKNDIFSKTYVREDYRDAARYAAQAHAGQTRSGGKPYISHPVRVANLVRKYKDSKSLNKLMAAAFLHDTIEDTDTTEEQLRKMFGDLVASLVAELTSDKAKIEKLGKAEYLTQKMIHMSSWGLVIKLADRLDNVRDIKTAKTPAWRHRYRTETENILNQLEQNRKLSGTHKNIIAAIRAKLAEIDEGYIGEAEEEHVKPRVYLDMDGVLADFFGEWSRISGVNHYKDINDVEAKLQLVREHPTFWVDLPLLPHARALIKTVVENFGEYRICSKPLEGDARSKPGKIDWIKKHLSDMPPAEIIMTGDKSQFAKADDLPCVLVDDYGVNINAWRNAGGIGLKYDDQNFKDVAKILVKLAKSGVSK